MSPLTFPSHPCTLAIVFCDDVPIHHFPGYFWRATGADWREISRGVWLLFRWVRIDGQYRWNDDRRGKA
jgi:hypothetical protein